MICECVLCHHNSYFLHQDSSRQSLLRPHGGVKSAWYSSTAAIIVTFTLREHQTSDSGQYLDGIAIGQCSASRHVSNVWNGEYNKYLEKVPIRSYPYNSKNLCGHVSRSTTLLMFMINIVRDLIDSYSKC